MRAGVLYGPMDIRVEEMAMPSPGPGEVLVEVKAAGICGGELHYHRHGSVKTPSRRLMDGHEFSGRIAALGEGVENREVGERVYIEPMLGCDKCVLCAMGRYNICKQRKGAGAGFREYTALPAEKAFPFADHISFEEAAVIEPLSIGVHAIRRAGITITDAVAIIGDGPIGLSTLQVAKAAGVGKALLIGIINGNLEIARKVGADMTVNSAESDAAREAMKFSGGEGFDVVFEAVGGLSDTMDTAVQIVKRGGTIVALGIFSKPVELDFGLMLSKEISLVFSRSTSMWKGVPAIQIAAEMLARGELDAQSLITHTFPLDKIRDAFYAAANKNESGALKVLITY